MNRPNEKRCGYSPRNMHEDRMKQLPQLIKEARDEIELATLAINMKKDALDLLVKEHDRIDDILKPWKKNGLLNKSRKGYENL